MGDMTENFSRSEFRCKCFHCSFDSISMKTVEICQSVRDFFGKPVTVNSGCRCPYWNEHVGGSEGSQHLEGTAADIVVKDVDSDLVWEYLDENAEELGVGGLGMYESFTHIDTRIGRARW